MDDLEINVWCTGLRALDLSGNHITVLNGFRSHEPIQELRLQMCPVSDAGLGELAQLINEPDGVRSG